MKKILLTILTTFIVPLTVSPLGAQGEPLESFSEFEEVTLQSLNVQLDTRGYKAAVRGDLLPEAITVLLEGREASVVGLQTGLEGSWTVQLYFDQEILDTHTLRWAARLLAEYRRELTDLGPVEVVVADPFPRTLGEPSRDPEVLDQILSQLAIQGESADSLKSHRRNLSAIGKPQLAEGGDSIGPEEERRLQQQLDRWLLHLNAHPRRGSPGVLFHISSGFESNLDIFYGPYPLATPSTPATETLIAIASYGWTVIPLIPEKPKAYLKSGFTLGSWRFLGFRGQGTGGAWLLSHEEDRDPELAEAFLKLGQVHFASQDYESARDPLKQAIFHFGQDQKTASQEAEALVLLAQSLLALDQEQKAWRVLERAYEIQPDWVESQFPGTGDFEISWKALEQLATWTTGSLVRSRANLEKTLHALRRQITVAYQGKGEPKGEFIGTKVSIEGHSFAYEGPSWSRSALPLAIAKARIRSLLEGEPEAEDFNLKLLPEEHEDWLEIEAPYASFSGTRWIRVTQAEGVEPILQTIHSIPPRYWSSPESQLRVLLPQTPQDEESWRIILVEDLFSREWAALFLD